MKLFTPLSKSPAHRSFFTPANIFLIIALIAGVLFCIFIPYGAGFDEGEHIVRIFDISGFNFLPNRTVAKGTVAYPEFFVFSYQRRSLQTPATDLFAPDKFLQKPTTDTNLQIIKQTRSIYPPVMFLPQAFAAGLLWRVLDQPVLPVIILLRLIGLAIYVLFIILTLRIVPFGKWVFMVLALAPMALFVTSTLNADGFTNAVSFLFIGFALYLYAYPSPTLPSRLIWALFGITILLGLAKPGAFVLLPLLLILPRKRFPSTGLFLALWSGAALAVILTVGWSALVSSQTRIADLGAQSFSHQFALIRAHPADFIHLYLQGTSSSIRHYIQDWIGVYGYWLGTVPQPVYRLFPLALLFALLAEPKTRILAWWTRIFLAVLFVLCFGAIILLFYFLRYNPGDISNVSRQGRYFIPVAPLLFAALAGLFPLKPWMNKIAAALSVVFVLAALGFYAFGMYAVYYTDCGYSVYLGANCTQPNYMNLDKKNAPVLKVNTATTVSQSFTDNCGRLVSVSVLINSLPSAKGGTLRYALLDYSGKELMAKDYPTGQIKPGAYLTMPVNLQLPSDITTYTMKFTSNDLRAPDGIGIAYRPEPMYNAGEMVVNGQTSGGDTIFHFTCANPWKK